MSLYSDLQAKLGNRAQRKIGNNTYLRSRGDDLIVRLHNTDILIAHHDGFVTLNSGGYRTVTTKARISEYLQGTGYHVYQDKKVWYVKTGDGATVVPFEDGIALQVGKEQ